MIFGGEWKTTEWYYRLRFFHLDGRLKSRSFFYKSTDEELSIYFVFIGWKNVQANDEKESRIKTRVYTNTWLDIEQRMIHLLFTINKIVRDMIWYDTVNKVECSDDVVDNIVDVPNGHKNIPRH